MRISNLSRQTERDKKSKANYEYNKINRIFLSLIKNFNASNSTKLVAIARSVYKLYQNFVFCSSWCSEVSCTPHL